MAIKNPVMLKLSGENQEICFQIECAPLININVYGDEK